jgi:ferredoxin-NADP reductase
LFALKPGDSVEITPPLGFFTLRNTDRHILLVGTGTGVAPFRSMLATHLAQVKKPVTLLFGTRYEESILYRSEFEEFERAHSHFQFWPTLTRPHAEWKGRTGRVQSHLEEALGGRTDLDVYLCGLKEMVDDMRRQLKARGFDRRQIVYEKYD